MDLSVVGGTKTRNIFDCVVTAIRERNDVVDFCISYPFYGFEARMLATFYFATMISAFSPYRYD